MGFALFEQSGTFNPADYGLIPGDVLNVIVVGGGGGGCGVTGSNSAVSASNTAAGASGSASSFGSYVTATGGGGGAKYGATQSTVGHCLALKGDVGPENITGSEELAYGSCGGGGWYPGTLYSMQRVNPSLNTDASCLAGRYVVQYGAQTVIGAACGGPNMKGGKNGRLYGYGAAGPGGGGYGGGGGGALKRYSADSTIYAYSCLGGNSGEQKFYTHKLSSLAAIRVTVGKGGKGGGSSLDSNGRTLGGDGANGCVAVFW